MSDGPSGIGAGYQWRESGRECRSRPARTPTWDTVQVPRVFHRAEIAGLVGGPHGELVHIALSEGDGTSRFEFGHDGRVVCGLERFQHMGATGSAHPLSTKNVFV